MRKQCAPGSPFPPAKSLGTRLDCSRLIYIVSKPEGHTICGPSNTAPGYIHSAPGFVDKTLLLWRPANYAIPAILKTHRTTYSNKLNVAFDNHDHRNSNHCYNRLLWILDPVAMWLSGLVYHTILVSSVHYLPPQDTKTTFYHSPKPRIIFVVMHTTFVSMVFVSTIILMPWFEPPQESKCL